MSRRVKPVQDQRMKRRRAVIVGSSSDNGQSRTVLERPQGVGSTHPQTVKPDIHG
jgi:hypothetical protein